MSIRTFGLSLTAAIVLATASATPAMAADESDSYGYFRVVEGTATLTQAGSGDRAPAEVNQPLLVGDRIFLPGRSRLEAVLPDGNLVRLDGGSELVFEKLAGSPDASDRGTVLRLLEGNLQLVVAEDALGEELPTIETPNATVRVRDYGVYRVTADRGGWSEVVVRDGHAEVVTDRGSVVVREDEQATVEGERWPSAQVQAAAGADGLERWGQRLDEEAAAADLGEVDDNLRYAAAPLSRYGSWVSVGSRRAWRPTVAAGWRPYWHGRWSHTPAGLTWVAYEPWGWVPYHYGSWDFEPAFGWVWFPGYRWAPAWVYWYWGPSYVGWCPVGYYTRYYGYHGYRHGVYGWAGGRWDGFDHWNFVDHHRFVRTDVRDYILRGRELRERVGRADLPRGIITTDTRPIGRGSLGNPGDVMEALRRVPRARDARTGGDTGELPDVSPFIARTRILPQDVARRVATDRPEDRVEGSPLAPDTLGRRPVARNPRDTGDGAERIVRSEDGRERVGTVVRGGTPRSSGGDEPQSAGPGEASDVTRRQPVSRRPTIDAGSGGDGSATAGSGSRTSSDTDRPERREAVRRVRPDTSDEPSPSARERQQPSRDEAPPDRGDRDEAVRRVRPEAPDSPPPAAREEQRPAERPTVREVERDRGDSGGDRETVRRVAPESSDAPPPRPRSVRPEISQRRDLERSGPSSRPAPRTVEGIRSSARPARPTQPTPRSPYVAPRAGTSSRPAPRAGTYSSPRPAPRTESYSTPRPAPRAGSYASPRAPRSSPSPRAAAPSTPSRPEPAR